MNNVNLIGRITADTDIKVFGKGKDAVKYCRFTLAIRDGKDKEGKDKTQFISCAAWGSICDILEQYIKKGDMLAVDGKLVQNNYENKNGDMVYQTEVRINNVYLLPNYKEESKSSKYHK